MIDLTSSFLGRFDLSVFRYQCTVCGKVSSPLDLANLVCHWYWPAAIVNTQYVFTVDILTKWDLMQKRLPGSSESGFLCSLEDFSILRGRISLLESLEERSSLGCCCCFSFPIGIVNLLFKFCLHTYHNYNYIQQSLPVGSVKHILTAVGSLSDNC